MRTQAELCEAFQALHKREGAFIIPNPWDIGTARMLVSMGFESLATTSAGMAFAQGKPDHQVDRETVLTHCRQLASAVDAPLNADLGNGFGDTPESVAETYRLAAATGLAGASIEDMKPDRTIYPLEEAVERVQAASAVTKALPFPFVLTARCENYLVGRRDLDDTIKRLQAYQEAGADVLYAPGLTTRDEIAAVVSAIDRPLNVIVLAGMHLTIGDLQSLGVKRITTGSALAVAAFTAFTRAAQELRDNDTFSFITESMPSREIVAMFG